MEIIIHLGLHKTGSTFFQKNVFKSFDGWHYIDRTDLEQFKFYVLNTSEFNFSLNRAYSIFINLFSNNSCPERVIISDEEFCGMPYMGAIDRKIIANRLINIFKKDELKFFLVLREQQALLKSLYLQYIKTGGTANPVEFMNFGKQPLLINSNYFLFYEYLSFLEDRIGEQNVLCLLFEEFSDSPYTFFKKVADFIDIEFNYEETEKSVKNFSINPVFLRIMIFLNKFSRSYKNPFGFLPFGFYRLYSGAIIRCSVWLKFKRQDINMLGFNQTEKLSLKDSNRKLIGRMDQASLMKYRYL
ncbi:sulfotransferase domain-containing protein [Flavilitoribacter nigricans]|uniref:Sulfotransferase domain-containing protein n=1 Tax=Flavilitoribacter nigricans (strain ATCC 23147 / DSM 23189 / NBRC 102662 / NCIMB 1420 / SS-2) TaxID=1122177 RepID=A0A2D0MYZ5_FLAN2|nr:sulfotransferase domain-containing protein [Flavilitoribacter nigricans]PHN01494.1 hypothetical protein CRP01_36955 [Flavilitoribacter nigricans DSM 23189 = NBRC 102662]